MEDLFVIVDDNELYRQAVRRVLTHRLKIEEKRIYEFSEGSSFLVFYKANKEKYNRFHLFLDYEMPQKSGAEIVMELLTDLVTEKVSILMMSSRLDIEIFQINLNRLNCFRYEHKPVDISIIEAFVLKQMQKIRENV